jgi:hypothetical protein
MDNSKLPTTRKPTYTIRYLKNEPIANLVAVRAAYSWLSVDIQIVYLREEMGEYTSLWGHNAKGEATHFSVHKVNDCWWNHYIYHESLQYKLDDLREYYADCGW